MICVEKILKILKKNYFFKMKNLESKTPSNCFVFLVLKVENKKEIFKKYFHKTTHTNKFFYFFIYI